MTTPIIEIADKFLLTSGVTSLPLSLEVLEGIAKRYGWIIETYTAAHDYIEKHNLENLTKDRSAFTFTVDNQRVIFYNGEAAHQNKIHAICHEMGHIVLRHDLEHVAPIQEWEADVFAEEMISPTCSRARTQLQEDLCKQLGIRSQRNIVSNVILITCLVVLTLSVAVSVLARTSERTINNELSGISSSSSVFVTQYGDKYHVDGCHYIADKDNLTELTAEDAERKGYEPCRYCCE